MMTVIPIIAVAIRVVWLAVEYLNLRPHQVRPTKNWDRQSARFWDVANLLEPFGLVLGFVGIGRIEIAADLIRPLGLALLMLGIALRWTAIRRLFGWQLVRFFRSLFFWCLCDKSTSKVCHGVSTTSR